MGILPADADTRTLCEAPSGKDSRIKLFAA
jgi:hypothetical protein